MITRLKKVIYWRPGGAIAGTGCCHCCHSFEACHFGDSVETVSRDSTEYFVHKWTIVLEFLQSHPEHGLVEEHGGRGTPADMLGSSVFQST